MHDGGVEVDCTLIEGTGDNINDGIEGVIVGILGVAGEGWLSFGVRWYDEYDNEDDEVSDGEEVG